MYDIFISYRTTHSNWVETLAHNLKSQNYAVFLDQWELIPGQDFPAKIHEALKNARCAILVATPDTSDSGWVQQELQMMINRKTSDSGFFFIPVVMVSFPICRLWKTCKSSTLATVSRKVIVVRFNGCFLDLNKNHRVLTLHSKAKRSRF